MVFPSSGPRALWSTLQEGQEFSNGPFMGDGEERTALLLLSLQCEDVVF